jgi:cytochrome c-type biogenesis protein
MSEISPLSFGFALGGGLLTILSPCVLPVIPLVLGRSFKSHRLDPVILGLGLVSGFALVGSLLGVASSWFVISLTLGDNFCPIPAHLSELGGC